MIVSFETEKTGFLVFGFDVVVGFLVGFFVGLLDGFLVVFLTGLFVGFLVGLFEGFLVGFFFCNVSRFTPDNRNGIKSSDSNPNFASRATREVDEVTAVVVKDNQN